MKVVICLRAVFALLFVCLFASISMGNDAQAAAKEREHLVYWKGTPQELEVFRIYGREDGPTIMIMGGIQGDEPGGFLSADLYADLALKKGNLIVVPRANFPSVVQYHRGPAGDMNRKFEADLNKDPDRDVVNMLKALMAEADVMLNLHDGSGYYRPVWENDMANPNRYGQCIIADADVYTHQPTGRVIELARYAEEVVRRVNEDILTPLHKFHFFNMFTVNDDTRYMEQRKSATYYALTQVGIPAYGIETSKQLPDVEMKIYQHNLAINAFMDLYGLEVEYPRILLEKPRLGYLVVSVNGDTPLALADKQTLLINRGDTIEVVDVGANYDRGVSVEIQGFEGLNDLQRVVEITGPTNILIRKENTVFANVKVDFLPDGEEGGFPRLLGENRISPVRAAVPADAQPLLASLEAGRLSGQDSPHTSGLASDLPEATLAAVEPENSFPVLPVEQQAPEAQPITEPGNEPESAPITLSSGGITGFLVEVDGKSVEIVPGGQLAVPLGARLKIVDLKSEEALPEGVVMNLRGFVPTGMELNNTGEDRGATADTARDMIPRFSKNGKGEIYEINAELGPEILASCSIKLVPLKLESITVRIDGQDRVMRVGTRNLIPAGTRVELIEIALKDGLELADPRYTLAGHALPGTLPQTLTMRDIAINLAVFSGDILAGKVTWVPKK